MLSHLALVCPQCAAPLPRVALWRTVQCAYCGATIVRGAQTVERATFRAAWLRARATVAPGPVWVWRDARYRVLATLGHGAQGEVLLAERLGAAPERVTLKLARDDSRLGALTREFDALRALQSLQGTGAAYFTRRLPQPVGLGLAQSDTGAAHHALLLRHPPGYWGSLASVVQAQPHGIDPRHGVWLWRRLLEVLGFLHAAGWTHGDLRPAHALVHPRDHGVLMIGWSKARHRVGAAHAAAVARDLQQAAWTVRAVLHGATDVDAPGVGARTPAPLAGATLDPTVDGTYTYTLTFSLAGYKAGTAALSGRFAADNEVLGITLNGTPITSAGGGFSSWTTFTAAGGTFLPGVNTLSFNVSNFGQASGNPSGLRVELGGTAAVPEPQSWVLLVAGFGLVGIAARRRSKVVAA